LRKYGFSRKNTTPAKPKVRSLNSLIFFKNKLLSFFDMKAEKGKINYAFSLLRCALEDTGELNEIWKNYGDEVDFKVGNQYIIYVLLHYFLRSKLQYLKI
jgi:hypothetical protein